MIRTACKTIAGLILALTVGAAGLIAAPAATAEAHHGRHNHTWVQANTTRMDFQKHKTDTYSIKTRAHQRSGKGIAGKAILKINGKQQRWHRLKGGNSLFRIDRDDLQRGKSRIVVVIKPNRPQQNDRSITRFVVNKPKPKPKSTAGQRVVKIAKAQVGDRYQYGKAGPSRFDCSGLVRYSYKKATGKNLPHQSRAQKNSGRKVAHAKPGDIVWTPGHVSIYVGNGKVVEAARPGTKVRVVKMWQRNPTYVRP